jgi:hypothetical protein
VLVRVWMRVLVRVWMRVLVRVCVLVVQGRAMKQLETAAEESGSLRQSGTKQWGG